MSLPLSLLLLVLAGATPAPGEGPAALCLPDPDGTPLTLAAEGLRAWPSGDLAWPAGPHVPVALGCAPGRAALGLMEGKQGRLLPFAFTAGQWSARPPGSRLRGVPRLILPAGERWAVLAERKGAFTLYLVDPALETRPRERPLPGRPAGLAQSADGSTLLVALGREVRTFTLDPFRSSVTFLFDAPIDHLAGRPGVDRLLVAWGRHLAAVDPGDTPTRGTLPVRAETDLPGPILDLAWAGRGEMALALVASTPAVLFLSGDDLSLLERRDLDTPARALAAGDAGRTLILLTNGTVAEIAPQPDTLERARAPEPSPPPDAGRDRPRVTPAPGPSDPPPATPELRRKHRKRPPLEERPLEPGPEPAPPVTRVPKTPLPTTPPSAPREEPIPVTPPTTAPRPEPREEPAPAPAPPAAPATEAPPPAAPPPEPRKEPAPIPAAEPSQEEMPTGTAPVALAPAAPEQPPVELEPETSPGDTAPTAPPIPDEPAGGESSTPVGWTLPDGPPAGGTVMGRLTGQASLVAEVVLLGPNNLLREAARVPPHPTPGDGEAAAFLAGDLAPGRYRVVPMGTDGASLACRPPFATVTVTRERGARTDFEVLGRR